MVRPVRMVWSLRLSRPIFNTGRSVRPIKSVYPLIFKSVGSFGDALHSTAYCLFNPSSPPGPVSPNGSSSPHGLVSLLYSKNLSTPVSAPHKFCLRSLFLVFCQCNALDHLILSSPSTQPGPVSPNCQASPHGLVCPLESENPSTQVSALHKFSLSSVSVVEWVYRLMRCVCPPISVQPI